MTSWCPSCGAEYREGVTVCPDCQETLVDTPPEPDVGDVLVYELDEFTADQRGAVEQRLQASTIVHDWVMRDGQEVEAGYEPGQPWDVATDLVVGEHDEDAVDAILDQVESPDALEIPVDAGLGEDDDDEDTYAVMTRLYEAADRLKDDPDDDTLAGEFFDAADDAAATGTPFGIDEAVWRRVQELAQEVSTAMEQDEDDEVVAGNARRLRDVLFGYV